MRRVGTVLAAALAALALSACASGGPKADNRGGVQTIRQMMQLAGAHFDDPSQLDHEVLLVDTVPGSVTTTWRGVLRAYTTLRIPVTRYDEGLQWIGGSAQPLGLVAGQKPAAWLDCGHGMAEEYANAYQVTFSIATRVVPLPSGSSTVQSLVVASARPRDVSTAPFRCTTKGALEKRIADIVRAQSATASP